MATQQTSAKFDLSGGVQTATSRLLAKSNETDSAKNATFNFRIGAAARREGYEQVGRTIQQGKNGLLAAIYKYSGNNKIYVGINNSDDTASTIRFLDNADYWTTVTTYQAPNVKMDSLNYLDEFYIAGYAKDTNYYAPLINIDSTQVASTTRNVRNAPNARFITEFQGRLYAIGCKIGNYIYRDRAYRSSPALGAITYVQNDQKGLLQQLAVDNVRYLKAGMTIDIYTAGTEAKLVSSLAVISVDKKFNKITFAPTTIDVKDNDELWLTGRKGQLSTYWNTDYPTPENSDFLRIPPGVEQNPEIMGHGKINGRLMLFTRNSMWKWDGQNLTSVSETIGCTAHATIKNIGSWIIWLHTSGVWGYNDSTGQLKLLSRGIKDYIDAASQTGLENASAVVNGRVYKLALGELAALGSITTSTSTSSTSTSSTSSSTSSTSTSSTSTSSTSSSTSISSTSTSSTSVSTSSTSVSTSSTSVSTSSTSVSTSTSSTSTSTVASTKQVVRFIYDFDMNAWWPEYHKREFRYQVMHTMHGYTKPYFIDDTGRLFRDEVGAVDHIDPIPFEVEVGREDHGTRMRKRWGALIVESENARATQVLVSVQGAQYRDVGQITEDIQEIKLPSDLIEGRDINVKFVHNDTGDRPVINGLEYYFSVQEMKRV